MKKLLVKASVILFASFMILSIKTNAIAGDISDQKIVDAESITPVTPAKPETITGLKIDSDDYTLHWNAVPGAYSYEIICKDSSGSTYYVPGENGDTDPVWYSVKDDDQVVEATSGASVGYIMAKLRKFVNGSLTNDSPKAGETYTILVRAVNAGLDANGKVTTYAYGESASLTYKMPSHNFDKTKDIKNFSYEGFDKAKERYIFAIPSIDPYTEMNLQISLVSSSFANAKVFNLKYDASKGKYYVDASNLEMFDDLYFRVYCPRYKTPAKTYSFSNVVSGNVSNKKDSQVGTITNLKLSESSTGLVELTFDASLKEDAEIVAIYSTTSNFAKWTAIKESNGVFSVPLSKLTENQSYYFRVYAKKELTSYMWNSANESKDDFTKRVKKAIGNDKEVTVVTPFKNLEKYYCKITSEVTSANSNTVSYVKQGACTDIKKISLENVSGKYKVVVNSNTLKADEKIQVCYSKKESFTTGKDSLGYYYTNTLDFNHESVVSGEMYLSLSPQTYYVKARVIKDKKGYDSGNNRQEDYLAGKWSNTVKVTPKVSSATITFHDKTNDSVTIYVGSMGGVSSGVEIQKFNGKRFAPIYHGADPYYTLDGLSSGKKYTFRARRYYYNYTSMKTVYSDWVEDSFVTWGSDITVTATAASNKSVKISWNRIKGSNSYEVYRAKTEYNNNTKTSKYYSYQLLKKVSSSTTSLTDNSLNPNSTYVYMVKAVRIIDGKTYSVSGEDSVYLGNEKINVETRVGASGTVIGWKPVIGAKNYYVEKYYPDKKTWATVKTLSSKKLKYSAPVCKSKDKNAQYDKYRVRAGLGNDTYSSYSSVVYVYPALATPKNVVAKVASDGSVKITWNKVSGADYYVVYKTKSSHSVFDSVTQGYTYTDSVEVIPYVKDSKSTTGYSRVDKGSLTECEAVDRRVVDKDSFGYTHVLNEGPYVGTSYYYVVAYKEIDSDSAFEDDKITLSSSGSEGSKAYCYSTKYSPEATLSASKGKITVNWSKYDKAASVEIYRAAGSSKSFSLVGKVTSTSTLSYCDKDVTKGKYYSYKIRVGIRDEYGELVYTKFSKVVKVKAK